MIARTFRNGVSIHLEPTEVKTIDQPKDLCFTDELYMNNRDVWLITKVDSEEVELMLKTRRIIKKNDISSFLQEMSFVKRADCFNLAS